MTTVDIAAQEAGTGRRCTIRIHPDGVWFLFGKQYTGFDWAQVRQVSFDDPGRTKANVGAIAMFGVLGMAARQSFTIVTVVADSATWQFHAPFPVGQFRASLRNLVREVPALLGKLYVDGVLVNSAAAAESLTVASPQANAPGWYPDPLGLPNLRWFDGTSWTDHTTPAPQAPPS